MLVHLELADGDLFCSVVFELFYFKACVFALVGESCPKPYQHIICLLCRGNCLCVLMRDVCSGTCLLFSRPVNLR